MSCQAAIPLGAQAANTVLSRIAGTEPAVRRTRRSPASASASAATPALIQLAHLDDTRDAAVHRRTRGGVDQGSGLQGHGRLPGPRGAQAGLVLLAQGRQAGTSSSPRRRQSGDAPAPVTLRSTPNGSRCCGRCCSPSPTRSWARATESDDVLQESYLRWAEVDLDDGAGHQGLPRPARHPAGAQRAAGRSPAGARTTSGRGCPNRCCSTTAGPRRPTSCSPSRCRWRCWWCWRR